MLTLNSFTIYKQKSEVLLQQNTYKIDYIQQYNKKKNQLKRLINYLK